MQPSSIYCGIFGNSITFPFQVRYVENATKRDVNAPMPDGIIESTMAQVDNIPKILRARCSEWPSENHSFNLMGIPGTRFKALTAQAAQDAWKGLMKDISPEWAMRIMATTSYGDVWATDPELTRLIPIKGFIGDYLRNAKQVEFTAGDTLFKEAGSQMVKLTCYDKMRGIFDVYVQYKNDVNKIFKTTIKTFNKVDRYTVMGILRTIGFAPSEVVELVEKASINNTASADMPKDATPENIEGGDTQTKARALVKKLVGKALTADNVSNMGASIAGAQLADIAEDNDNLKHILTSVHEWTKKSELCACEFEKLAIETQSDQALNVAKVLVSAYYTGTAIGDACNGKVMNHFKEAMESVRAAQPEIEKLAYELIAMKIDGFKAGTQIISPNLITAAIGCMDRLVKVANSGGTAHSEVICEECGKKAEAGQQLIQGKCPACYQEEQQKSNDGSATVIQDDKDRVTPVSSSMQ